jgi:hypothetical protein
MHLSPSLLAALVTLGVTTPTPAPTPRDSLAGDSAAATTPMVSADAAVPFGVGEAAEYDVKFSGLKVGSGSMRVAGIEDVRGRSAWHTIFQVKGGTFFFKVNDVFESWIDRETFSSLRFHQTQEEGTSDRKKRYEIYPDQKMYMEMDKDPPRRHESVSNPLDDGSFLFFVRTLSLEVGKTYESNRYFRPDRNPVRIRVLRRETISVPAGKFDCIVIQPIIKTKGIFSENGQAEVWLSDDARHLVVQLKSKLSIGSINLYLKSYKAGKTSGA